LNETVDIQGQVASVWDLSKGRKYVVQDDSGQIPVILWSNVLEAMPAADQLRGGAGVAVRGRVTEYKGELRIVPFGPSDVRVTAPEHQATRPAVPLAKLAAQGAGRSAYVAGVIQSMQAFSKGVKLHIKDASGEAVVLLWQNLYDSLPVQDDLCVGARIGVFGEINHFRDEWEIVPRSKTEVTVLEKASSE